MIYLHHRLFTMKVNRGHDDGKQYNSVGAGVVWCGVGAFMAARARGQRDPWSGGDSAPEKPIKPHVKMYSVHSVSSENITIALRLLALFYLDLPRKTYPGKPASAKSKCHDTQEQSHHPGLHFSQAYHHCAT